MEGVAWTVGSVQRVQGAASMRVRGVGGC
jgi:hypothetical protein